MKIPRSTFYYKSQETKNDSEVLKGIHEISKELNQVGYISMTKMLKERGFMVNKKRVYRIMKENNLLCRVKRQYKPKTTQSKHNFKVYPNLIKKVRPNPFKVLVGDVTSFDINSEDYFLALLMRLLSRRIMGAAISNKNNTDLVEAAFISAKEKIGDLEGYYHHSDSDVRYCSERYISILSKNKMNISMCLGNAYENAHAESLNKTIKYKEINLSEYKSFEEARAGIFRFIHLYNTMKPHSALGWMTPQKYEEKYLKKVKNGVQF